MALGRPEYEDTKNQMATKQQNQNPNRLNMHSQSFSLCAFACVTFFFAAFISILYHLFLLVVCKYFQKYPFNSHRMV